MFYSNLEKHKSHVLHLAGLIVALTCLLITTGCEKSDNVMKNEDAISSVVRSDLAPIYKDILSENPSAPIATPRITFKLNLVDLNSDGTNEYVVEEVTVDGRFMGGASGNEQKYVYQYKNSIWQKVGTIEGNDYSLLETKTGGYKDITSSWHNSASSYTTTIYKWDAAKAEYISAGGSEITGAHSALDAGDKLREGDKWYSPDSSFTQCFNSGGPAAKLDSFVGFTDKPYTHDVTDSSGNVVKVEVINASGGGGETVWTYYKNKSQCEAEQINSTKSLADKYR